MFLCVFSGYGQNQLVIEGKVSDKESNEAIAFAKVYHKNSRKGTITNAEGYFKLIVQDIHDTILISFVGYKEKNIHLEPNQLFYDMRLDRIVIELDEVVVTPTDNLYLYELVQSCRKNPAVKTNQSKAYYELESYVDNNQIELVEGYYNINVKGYRLLGMHLKTGRIALRMHSERVFASLESSNAILMHNIFDKNEYFPSNPMEFQKGALRKNYYLDIHNKYVDKEGDSIFVVNYMPKDTTGKFFSGQLWLNATKTTLTKITLYCAETKQHPFLPLYFTDSIEKVGFSITHTFQNSGEDILFNHTDFVYNVAYASRNNEAGAKKYTVTTKAVLYAYDYEHAFILPNFKFNESNIGEYRKINALPYNQFFWDNHDEYRLNDSDNSNQKFFEDKNSMTNRTQYSSTLYNRHPLLVTPYRGWSKYRVQLTDHLKGAKIADPRNINRTLPYNLSIKIFTDFNYYKDSLHVQTATIFDPYESYYLLPINEQTNCFVNIYFDLHEIARREFVEQLSARKMDMREAQALYHNFMVQFENSKANYLRTTLRGTNEKEMNRYNELVLQQLKINNQQYFNQTTIE